MIKKRVRCASCNYKGFLSIPKGQKVKYARCPGCGRVSLK